MNLRFVEAFYWAATLQSVTRAADRLHLTQSALSSRIAALEGELGVLLLDRRERKFRLTGAGQRFVTQAAELLAMMARVRQDLGAADVGPTTLRIGAIESVVHSWLPAWLQTLRTSHPDFQLELTVEASTVLMEHIRRGTLDLVFTALGGDMPQVRSLALPSMPMTLLGLRGAARGSHCTPRSLTQQELITFQRGSQPYQALLQWFHEAGLEPPRIHAVSSISAMLQLAAGGFGLAMLPRAVLKGLPADSPLQALAPRPALPALPIRASYRDDPGSTRLQEVLASVQAHLR